MFKRYTVLSLDTRELNLREIISYNKNRERDFFFFGLLFSKKCNPPKFCVHNASWFFIETFLTMNNIFFSGLVSTCIKLNNEMQNSEEMKLLLFFLVSLSRPEFT